MTAVGHGVTAAERDAPVDGRPTRSWDWGESASAWSVAGGRLERDCHSTVVLHPSGPFLPVPSFRSLPSGPFLPVPSFRSLPSGPVRGAARASRGSTRRAYGLTR